MSLDDLKELALAAGLAVLLLTAAFAAWPGGFQPRVQAVVGGPLQ